MDQLLPGDRRAARRDFHHFNAALHGADVEAKPAAHAIGLTDHRTGPLGGGFHLAVGLWRVGVRFDHQAFGVDQVNALMRRVVAGDVAEVALDALRFIDAGDGAEGEIEVLEIRNAVEALTADVRDGGEAFGVHPIRETVAKVLNDAVAMVHDGGAYLQTRRAQQQELRRVAPGADAAHGGDGQRNLVGPQRRKHVQGDRLHSRTGIATVPALAADIGRNLERVEINGGNGVDGVDQRESIGPGGHGGARGVHDVGDVGG